MEEGYDFGQVRKAHLGRQGPGQQLTGLKDRGDAVAGLLRNEATVARDQLVEDLAA
jgi:hypothetical protein